MRPPGLLYGLDDRPPVAILVLTAAQHVAVITAIGVIFPKLVLAHANLNPEQNDAVLGLSMLALGIATLLQTQRLGGIGSGFLAPVVFTAAYLAPAISAVEQGGLPLVFGMTIFAGVCEIALAPLLRLLRPFLPTEIANGAPGGMSSPK
jgi:xanthine permease XanP